MAKKKAKKNKFDAAINTAPEGMLRVVEYSSITGISNPRYKPDKADIYLKAHFESIEDKYRAGNAVMNRNCLNAAEKRMIEGWVLTKMVKLGMSRKEIMDIMETEWNIDRRAAATLMAFVLNNLVETDQKQKEQGRAVYLERLENLYGECLARKDISNALKVLEQIAKAKGFFSDTTVVAPVMNFKFGGDVDAPKADFLVKDSEENKDVIYLEQPQKEEDKFEFNI